MQKIKYADMHCDTLTACGGEDGFLRGGGQCSAEKLIKSGCAAQCFAVFYNGGEVDKHFELYKKLMTEHGDLLCPVLRHGDFSRAEAEGKLGCVLTVENLGFINSPRDIPELSRLGVRMASLVWNRENALAYPNLLFENGAPCFERRERRGLKRSGFEVVEMLDGCKIIIDVSHLSDGGLDDILRGRKTPIVASHSNCAALRGVCRNLEDSQIKAIADCGGVVGVNFCADFLGSNVAETAVEHVLHIIDAAGEDAAALGSDFDGMSAPEGMEDCTRVPAFLGLLSKKLSPRVLEKVARGNFLRVFKEVCG